jgi:hypothetical protein
LPRKVKFALTTTPVEARFDFDADPAEFPPAVKFHYRGGARPAGFREAYKVAPFGGPVGGRQHHPNVVFMRYTRLPDGRWQDVRRPSLQLVKRSRLRQLQMALRPAAPVSQPVPA